MTSSRTLIGLKRRASPSCSTNQHRSNARTKNSGSQVSTTLTSTRRTISRKRPLASQTTPAPSFSVTLPEAHAEAAQHNFQMMLSGHTHGGQLCLPGGRHIVCPVKDLTREFIAGRWQSGSLQGYTSPGTGCCGVAARLNCPPEITVHILHRADA